MDATQSRRDSGDELLAQPVVSLRFGGTQCDAPITSNAGAGWINAQTSYPCLNATASAEQELLLRDVMVQFQFSVDVVVL